MGDRATLEKARKELEELYLGVPDDSVNLTFQDLAEIRETKKTSPKMGPISEKPQNSRSSSSSPFARLPSVDFNKALEASYGHNHLHHHHVNTHNHHHQRPDDEVDSRGPRGGHTYRHDDMRSMAYDDMSHVSGMSVGPHYGLERGGGRRRPGIPHSNICAVCSNYIYIFRHRCLVCGRVYCRQCVSVGMGEMTEGRKCIDCLGRKFSQRYIRKAGNVGCCIGLGYPSTVKQQELSWAEKGPRRSRENVHGHSVMVSRSRSPIGPRSPRTPTRGVPPTNPPSFVAGSPYSPYSQAHSNHHHLPF